MDKLKAELHDLEDAFLMETTIEEAKRSKYGKKLLKYLRIRMHLLNLFIVLSTILDDVS
jgi:hypothetical protein